MNKTNLIQLALDARQYAYAPYSHFTVGAALLGKDGRIFTGCNVESAAYSPSNCAERTAIFKAISEGCTEFSAIAVAGGAAGQNPSDYCYPCGVCRQVLHEFCPPEFSVILARTPNDYRMTTLAALLPHSFGAADLERA